jgi:hypothetical protein
MRVTNYATLISEVKNKLEDLDIDDTDVQGWVQLFEADFNRRMRVDQMPQRASLPGNGDEYYSLPCDCRKVRHITVNGNDLEYLTPEQLDMKKDQLTDSTHYTIEGQAFRILTAPTDECTIEILYYASVPSLGSKDEDGQTINTNWLLDMHPDAYLYGTVAHGNAHLFDPDYYNLAVSRLQMILEELEIADWHDRWSGSRNVIRRVV